MRIAGLLLPLVLVAGLARAASDPAADARAASGQLQDASIALARTDSARDRVKALTAVVQAYEAGLTALRAGLRRAAIREAQLSRQLKAQEVEIGRLVEGLDRAMERNESSDAAKFFDALSERYRELGDDDIAADDASRRPRRRHRRPRRRRRQG